MHSQPPTHSVLARGRPFEPFSAIAKYVDAIRAGQQAAGAGDEDAVLVPLERMAATLELLSGRERAQAAQKACELLLETSPVSPPLVRCVGELDQRFSVSAERSEVVAALATRGLLQGIANLPADDLLTLRRFAPPSLGEFPDLVEAVRNRFITDVRKKNGLSAIQIYRAFSDVTTLPRIKSEIHFARASIRLIPLIVEPWSPGPVAQEAPKFARGLFPLLPELAGEYLDCLEEAFDRAVSRGAWSRARAVVACPIPQGPTEGVSDADLAGFRERIGAAALKPLDALLRGVVNYGDARVHLEANTSVNELLQDLYSDEWKERLGVATRTKDAVRKILSEQRDAVHTIRSGIDTVAALTAIYSLYSSTERQSGDAPVFKMTRVWIGHKLQELSADLWCLAALGAGDPPHPAFAEVRIEEFARFRTVLGEALKTFHLEPAGFIAAGRALAEWEARFEFHRRGREEAHGDQVGKLGLIQRIMVRWEVAKLQAQGWRALREGHVDEAAASATSLLGACARYPRIRHAIGTEAVESVCKLVASSCRSDVYGRGVFTSLLSQELRRERPDLTLLDSLARSAAQMYQRTGKPDTAVHLLELAKLCSKSGITPQEIAHSAAALKQRGLSRL